VRVTKAIETQVSNLYFQIPILAFYLKNLFVCFCRWAREPGGLNGARIRFSRSSVVGITAYAINPKVRLARIELTFPAWQASVLPLHHRRANGTART
jgi:hypothetical protein